MKVLVVGSGGREHALCTALKRSPRLTRLWCAPGNGGIEGVAECLPDLLASDLDGLLAFAQREGVDLTVVGPEAPLAAGIVDLFEAAGKAIYGPNREAAQLEASKAFAKRLMQRHNIPTAGYRTFTDAEEARHHVTHAEVYPLVVKADGLAGGKGVMICETTAEALSAVEDCMGARKFGEAGGTIVIEEFLRGEEASLHVVTDGETLVLLPTAQDHKRIGDGDTGKNTGGMGAYSPAPVAEGAAEEKVLQTILIPTIDALKREGIRFRGTLFAGLMFTKGGARVLEFNVRFGDPESEVILPRLQTDVLTLLELCAAGRLKDLPQLDVDSRACVGVVVASAGYPDAYQAGKRITGLAEAAQLEDVHVFHAGTRKKDADVLTAGGRVLCVSALGEGHAAARDRAYQAVGRIAFEGAYHRRDIAARALTVTPPRPPPPPAPPGRCDRTSPAFLGRLLGGSSMLRRLLLPAVALAFTAALLAPHAPAAQAGDLGSGARGPALEQALKSKRLKKVVWKEQSLKDTVTWLKLATGWNFVVNQAALAKANVDITAITFNADFDDVSVATLLGVLLEPLSMAVRVQDNLIWLTSKADAWGKLVTRLYGISHITWQKVDFIAPDINLKPSGFVGDEYEPEKLVEDDPLLSGDAVADLLKELVEPGEWQTDGWNLRATKDYLVIRVPAKVHNQIPHALAIIASMK